MGGKDKKGPRTKGNVKPSSSGRSAELLGHVTEFVGFSGLSEASYVPAVGANTLIEDASADLSIPADFRLSLRKMGKRDSTTKIKALQEFSELCEQTPVEVLKTVLPFWPRIFSRLAVDGDRRVRENLHKSHYQLSVKLGRNLAPFLKEIMGAWFTSQCDTYAPAASLATHSLQSCFPGNKLIDAISFCHSEIMDYILDALFKPDNLSDEQKERITIGGISGYSLLLQQMKVTITESEKFLGRHEELWRSAKIYKVIEKNDNLIIKKSWFGMIYSLIFYLPQVAKDNSNKVLPSIFSFLEDPESATLLSLWETVLKALDSFEDASNYVNFSLQVTPKFLNLLRNACSGNASKIGPLVVPCARILRNHRENYTLKQELDRQVVEAFFQGISSRNVSNSSLEASALSAALFQFMDFVVKTTDDCTHVCELFQSTVIPSLDLLIKSRSSDLVLSATMRQMALSLYCWFGTEEKIATDLWNLLEKFVIQLITQPPHPEGAVVEHVGLIILILIDAHPKLESRKKFAKRTVRIRFPDSDVNQEIMEPGNSLIRIPEIPVVFRQKVAMMGANVCEDALKCCEENECEICLCFLVSLTRSEHILRGFFTAKSVNSIENTLGAVRKLLVKLRDNSTCSLFFTILEVYDSKLGRQVLQDLSVDEETCKALTITALENPDLLKKQIVLEWLRSPNVAKLLASAAEDVATFAKDEEKSMISWKLLRAALRARKMTSSEPLLPQEHIDAIMNTFISNLKNEHLEWESINVFIRLLSETVKSISSLKIVLGSSNKWLDSLIEVLCSYVHIQPVSFEMLLELWTQEASSAAKIRCQSAIAVIKQNLHSNPELGVIERLVKTFQSVLALTLEQSIPDASCSLVHELLLKHEEWLNLISERSSYDLMAKEIISGKYCYSVPHGNFFRPVQLSDWSGLLKTALVVSTVSVRNQIFEQDKIEMIPYIFYASAVAEILLEINAKRIESVALKDIERVAEGLRNNANILLSSCSDEQKLEVFKKTMHNASQHQWIWCLAAKKLQGMCLESLEDQDFVEDYISLSSLGNDKLNNMAQAQITKLIAISTDRWFESYHLLPTIRSLLEQLKGYANIDTVNAVSKSVQILQSWQLKDDETFLFGQDLKTIFHSYSAESAWAIVEVIRFLSSVVELHPKSLTHSLWDFILCSMTSWCTTVEESWTSGEMSSDQTNNPVLLSFTVALCSLIQNCSTVIADIELRKEELSSSFPPNLVSEWNDVFSDAAYNTIVPLFLQLSRFNDLSHLSSLHLLETVALSIRLVPLKHLQPTVETLSPLLMARQSPTQLAAHALIVKLLPGIASREATISKEEIDGDEEKVERSPPSSLLFPLESAVLETIEETRCGDLHIVEPYSEECTQLIGYFLGWDLVLRLCGSSGSELRYQYASYLTNSKLISRLMDTLFCIIPHANFQQQVDLGLEFRPDITVTEKVIQDIATSVYSSTLRYLPAVVRRWCNHADKRTASLVEKFTSRCVSPVLCKLDLQCCSKTWDNMTVRVRPTAREVIATYKLNEEGSMELIMQLPANYPLGNIVVESGRKIGVTSNQWRSWILQLETFLRQQNGSILDGLTLWKRNVDKRFEGIEECCICYYVLHGSNYKLPKLSCRTCRKKFHGDCLYKWFSTSNNSSCPYCRNLF